MPQADLHYCTLQDAEAQEEGDLVAFWEAAGGGASDIEAGVCTPCQVPHGSTPFWPHCTAAAQELQEATGTCTAM